MFITKDIKTTICETHGNYESSLINFKGEEMWTSCSKCVKARMVSEHKERCSQEAKNRQQIAIKLLLKRAAIPTHFENLNFDNYLLEDGLDQLKVFNLCKRYADNFASVKQNNVQSIFYGFTGTGKTHMSISIIKQVLASGYTAAFTNMQDISYAVKESYNNENKTEYQILNEFVDIDLLVIDECAVKVIDSKRQAFDNEKLFYIINRRIEKCNPTIIITNELQKLEDKIGSRNFSRMNMSNFALNFNWQDYRKKNK